MKKLFLGVMLFCVVITQGWGATKTVCATGGDYTTIQAAIIGVNAGDTISICNGTYSEALIVTKANLTLRSQSGNVADVTITKNATVFSLESTNVTIKNLTINATNGKGIFGDWQANSGHTFDNLKITSSGNGIELGNTNATCSFTNLNITSTSGNGISFSSSDNIVNTFSNITVVANNGMGIDTYYGGGSFSAITVNSKNEALTLHTTTNNTSAITFDKLKFTTSATNKDGLHIENWNSSASNGYTITNSIITSGGNSINILKSLKVTISDTNVTSSKDKGIYLGWEVEGLHELKNIIASADSSAVHAELGAGKLESITANSAKGDGIYVGGKYSLIASNIKVTGTKNYGFRIGDEGSAANLHSLSNSSLTSSGIGLQVDKSLKLTLSDLNITSATSNGIELNWNSQGAHEFKRVNVTANNSNGINAYFGLSLLEDFDIKAKNIGINLPNDNQNLTTVIHRGFVTTTSGKGINTNDSTSRVSVEDVVISAGGNGIDIGNGISPIINRVCITKAAVGINLGWGANDARITNTKVDGNSGYGIYVATNPTHHVEVTSSCLNKSPFAFRQTWAPKNTFHGNYWNGAVPSGYDTSPLAFCPIPSCYSSAVPVPKIDYRFDECSWNGTTEEVKDSSGNNLNATAINSDGDSLKEAQINTGGKFVRSKLQYIQLPTLAPNQPNFNDGFTITTWAKFDGPKGSYERIFDFGNGEGKDNIILSRNGTTNDLFFRIFGGTDGKTGCVGKTISNVIDTNLNFWAVSIDSSGNYKILKNNSEIASDTTTCMPANVERRNNYIGKSNYNNDYFQGGVDEFKIFDSPLLDSQIQQIYAYEYAKKNYDGTARNAVVCGLSTCFTEDFNRVSLGTKWSIISTGAYPPNITDNKLMLTQNQTYIASGVSLVGDFPSANNLVEIEFEHNAYAGDGADGVSVILSDANITPVSGGFGGSLGYSPKSATLGFAGAWLGFGLDEFGNFANDDDGDQGRGCTYRPKVRIPDSVTIRGRGDTNRLNGYCFIANSGNLQTSSGIGIDKTSSTIPAPKSKYKFIIDTRGGTKITIQRDTNSSGYVTLPNMNEVNATQTAMAPPAFKLSFTGSTGGAKNYHSFDDLSIKALSCGTLGQDQNQTNSFFDAWEIGASYNIGRRKIVSKIAKSTFNLNVFALNEANTAYQDFNGTVCARVVDNNDINLTGWTKLLFNTSNPYFNQASFNTPYASKENRIALKWKKDQNSDCESMVEDNSTKSTDNFALRPQTYTKSSPASLTQKAGESFWLTLKATGPSNTSLLGYNATVPLTKSLIEPSKVCYFTDGNFTKKDGMPLTSLLFDESESNTSSEVKFNDVGVFTLNLKDTTWTNVDKGKTPAECISNSNTATLDSENRVGCNIENNITITSVPHHFNVSAALSNFEGSLFTYLSSDMNMSAKLDVNITAQSEQNTTTKNYTRECYAADTTHTVNYVSLAVEPSDALTLLKYYETNTSKEGNVSTNLTTFSISHSKDIFTTTNPGTSTLNYKLNFDRNSSKPVNPFDLNISKVTISEPNVEGNDTSVGNARFYYGRIKTKDITTDQADVNHSLHVEVYSKDSTLVSGFYQNTLNWWVNASDGVTKGNDLNATAYKDFTKISLLTTPQITSFPNLSNGTSSFMIKNSTKQQGATFHLDIPSWLWYSSIASREYNASIDCSYHPCFDYKFLENASGKKAITSGTFKGSTIGSDYNSTYQKKGVKTFR